MDVRNIGVVVEEVDAARTALQWALHNIIRCGDTITLIHVYPLTKSKTKKKARLLRLKGFHLALSFQEICINFSNTKVEIVVTEVDREGMKIVAMVREIGVSMLVVGLHDHSFLYKVFAIKQPPSSQLSSMTSALGVLDSSTNMDFSHIEISGAQDPDTPPPKVKYRICPDPSAIIWRLRRRSRRR